MATVWSECPDDIVEDLMSQIGNVSTSVGDAEARIKDFVQKNYTANSTSMVLEQRVSAVEENMGDQITWTATTEKILKALQDGQTTNEETLDKIQNYMRFSTDGLTFGKSGSD